MKLPFRIVDVFTEQQFGGNQLAVVTDARGLSDEQMQSIALEFNFAETTFVFPAGADGIPVRIFTPRAELPFAGHPSIGTAAVLVREGLAAEGIVTLALKVGPIQVEVGGGDQVAKGVLVREGTPEIRPASASNEQLASVLGLPREAVIDSFAASVGVQFTFVRLTDEAAVDAAVLDRAAWSRHLADAWAPHVYFFAGEPVSGGRLYARMFAPALGIEEDPATGAASIAVAGALAGRSGAADGAFALSIAQGVKMGRPSDISTETEISAGKVRQVRVGGGVSFFAEGSLEIA